MRGAARTLTSALARRAAGAGRRTAAWTRGWASWAVCWGGSWAADRRSRPEQRARGSQRGIRAPRRGRCGVWRVAQTAQACWLVCGWRRRTANAAPALFIAKGAGGGRPPQLALVGFLASLHVLCATGVRNGRQSSWRSVSGWYRAVQATRHVPASLTQTVYRLMASRTATQLRRRARARGGCREAALKRAARHRLARKAQPGHTVRSLQSFLHCGS
jgi:hypothetical protein